MPPASQPVWVYLVEKALPFASAILSAMVGAGAALLVTWLQHRFKRTGRYHELLAEKRLAAYDSLLHKVLEFHHTLSPMEHGVTTLRPPEEDNPLPGFSESQRQRADRVQSMFEDLTRFVAMNQIALGRPVVQAWNKHRGAYWHIRGLARGEEAPDSALIDALATLLVEGHEEICGAMQKLEGVEIEIPSDSERVGAIESGSGVAIACVEESIAKLERRRRESN